MLFDAISQAFLTAAGTSCVTSPSNEHTTSIPARCRAARTTRWQHEATSHLLEKPTAATEQLLIERSGDSAGEQTMPDTHTGDKGKAGHAQVLWTQLRSLCCHSLGLQRATTHQLMASTALTQVRRVGRCLQVDLFPSGWRWDSSHWTLGAHQVWVSVEINPHCSHVLCSVPGSRNRMGWILL